MAARGPLGVWGGGVLDARGPSPCHPCALPTRLLLQGCRRGRGGPILRAAGSHQAVHPDRLPGVDHLERGEPGFVSSLPPSRHLPRAPPPRSSLIPAFSSFRFLSKKRSETGARKGGRTHADPRSCSLPSRSLLPAAPRRCCGARTSSSSSSSPEEEQQGKTNIPRRGLALLPSAKPGSSLGPPWPLRPR